MLDLYTEEQQLEAKCESNGEAGKETQNDPWSLELESRLNKLQCIIR